MRPSCHSQHPKQRGFTLLEIMLVLVLIGLSVSAILPNLSGSDGNTALRTSAERFSALVQIAHETSLTTGKELGIQISDHRYSFVIWQQGKWIPLVGERLLKPVTLSDTFTLTLTPGDSVWKEVLEEEASQITTLLNDAFEERLIDKAFNDEDKIKEPDIFIWSSGELSPVEVQFASEQSGALTYHVILKEDGEIRVKDNTEAQQ